MKTAVRELEGVTATTTPGVLGFSEPLRASGFAPLTPPEHLERRRLDAASQPGAHLPRTPPDPQGMTHFSSCAAKITAAGFEGGEVVTMRSLGTRFEEAKLRKKKKKKKKKEVKRKERRWE